MYLTPKPTLYPQYTVVSSQLQALYTSKLYWHSWTNHPVSCNCGFVHTFSCMNSTLACVHTQLSSLLFLVLIFQDLVQIWPLPANFHELLSMESSCGTLYISVISLSMSYCVWPVIRANMWVPWGQGPCLRVVHVGSANFLQIWMEPSR